MFYRKDNTKKIFKIVSMGVINISLIPNKTMVLFEDENGRLYAVNTSVFSKQFTRVDNPTKGSLKVENRIRKTHLYHK